MSDDALRISGPFFVMRRMICVFDRPFFTPDLG